MRILTNLTRIGRTAMPDRTCLLFTSDHNDIRLEIRDNGVITVTVWENTGETVTDVMSIGDLLDIPPHG